MLSAFFGSDGSFPVQFAIIFAVIFVILAGGALLVRRLGGRGLSFASKAPPRGRQPRLGIVDVYELDRQRQLILLRRDNVEHLLLVGGPNDVVVERTILRSAGARLASEDVARDDEGFEVPAEPAYAPPASPPPPAREAARPDFPAPRRPAPEPAFAEPIVAEHAPVAPSFPMPLVVPAPIPGSDAPPPTAAPLRAVRGNEPASARTENGFLTDGPAMDGPAIPPRRNPEPQPGRILKRTPPLLVNPKPDVASERSRQAEPTSVPASATSEPDFEAAFAAALAAPVAVPTPTSASAPAVPGKVDAALLSDMARQLEEALRRPGSGAMPPPVKAAAIPEAVEPVEAPAPEPAKEPVYPVPRARPEPIEQVEPEPEPEVPVAIVAETVVVTPDEIIVVPPEPEPEPAPAIIDPIAEAMAASADAPPDADGLFEDAPPVPPAPPEPAPTPAPVPPPPVPAAPEVALTSKKAPPVSANPFSVEEIEAEFARLLGRPLNPKN